MAVEIVKGGKAINALIKQIKPLAIAAGYAAPDAVIEAKHTITTLKIHRCPECNKGFKSPNSLASHLSATKHRAYSLEPTQRLAELQAQDQAEKRARKVKPKAKKYALNPAVEEMIEQERKRRELADLKAAIHADLTKPEPPYFNTEAYSIALRQLTKPEAIKIAKNQELAEEFLSKLKAPAMSGFSSDEITRTSIKTTNGYMCLECEEVFDKQFKAYNHHLEEHREKVSPKQSKPASVAPRASQERLNVSLKGRKRSTKTTQRDSAEQAAFKRRVLANFGGKCAITGDELPINQACHIATHKEYYDHSTDNGLLLTPSLHALYDAGLMGIHPDTLTAHFKGSSSFSVYEGKKLASSIVPVNRDKLAAVWESRYLRK